MRSERGVLLLEALIALAILATAGVGLITLLAQATQTRAAVQAEERRVADASRLLTATTLLTQAELSQRIGSHRVGPYIVAVSRPAPTLYRVAIAGADSSGVELLVTVVHALEAR